MQATPFWCAFFILWSFSLVVHQFQEASKKYDKKLKIMDVELGKLEDENK